jgi:Ca2+-binding EF-hand superfamily protein
MGDANDDMGPAIQGKGGGQDKGQGGPSRDRVVTRMRRFDTDGDGRIRREDVPEGGQAAFRRIDANGDGVLDSRELDRFQEQ